MWTETPVDALIEDLRFEGSQTPRFVPQEITRQFVDSIYGFSQEILDILGQVSGVIVKVLVEFGCIQDETQRYKTKLNSVIGKDAVANYESIVCDFGWHGMKLNPGLFDALMREGLKCQHIIVDDPDKCMEQFRKEIKSAIHQAFPRFQAALGTRLHIQEDILDLAFMISTYALASLFLEDVSDNDIVEHNSYITFAIKEDCEHFVAHLIGQSGISFRRFYTSLFACIFCVNNKTFVDRTIIVGREGLVLYPVMLFSPKIKQQGGLNLALHRGAIRSIKLDYQRYGCIREESHQDMFAGSTNTEIESTKAFSGSKYLGLVPKTDWLTRKPDFFVMSSIAGNTILVKPTLRVYRKRSAKSLVDPSKPLSAFDHTPQTYTPESYDSSLYEVHFCYLRALENLACALYVPSSGTFSPQAEQNLAKQLCRELECTFWLCPSSSRRGGTRLKAQEPEKDSIEMTVGLLCIQTTTHFWPFIS